MQIYNIGIIEEYKLKNGLTVNEFCELCKISESVYYRIMRGGDVKLNSLFKITKKMGIPIHLIFKR